MKMTSYFNFYLFLACSAFSVSTSDDNGTEDFLPEGEEKIDGIENDTATSSSSSSSEQHRQYSTPRSTLPRELSSPYIEESGRDQVSRSILAKSALNNFKYVTTKVCSTLHLLTHLIIKNI